MTDCPSEDLLLELTSGRLEGNQAASLHEHIDACTSCLHAVAELLRADTTAPALYPARYRMIEESARGGQARVLRGYDALTRREVAIKELLPHEDPSEKARRRFVHEARLTASLTHPGIVPVFDIGFRQDGQPFYTMQFVRGRTLAQALRACGSLAERLRYLSHFHELCQAVAFAHSRGIVHRDIKPHNVVVGEFGQTMLIDWGLAKRTRDGVEAPLEEAEVAERAPDATVAGSVIGTPAYMSPEQASGRLEDVDERSDVFGLGAVLYELLTGRAPHAGSKVTELLDAARTVAATPVGPEAPRELAVIVHKALALDRAERYERAADLAADVDAYLTGGRVGAYEYSSWELLRRLVLRHKRTAAATVLALAALMAVLAALAVALRREDLQRRRAESNAAETMLEGAQTALAHRDTLAARAHLRTALETTDSLDARSLWRQLAVDPLLLQVRIGSQPTAIVPSPTERVLAVSAFLPGVRFIDLDTGVIDVLHTDQLSRLAFAPDGKTLFTVSIVGDVQAWDLATRRPRALAALADTIRAMGQTADARTLFIITGAGRIVRVDTATGAVTPIPLSRNAAQLAARPDGGQLAVVGETGELAVLDPATGIETPIACPRRRGMVAAYSADGRVLGAVGGGGIICLSDGSAAPPRTIAWSVPGGLAFSPDGRRFVVGGTDGRAHVFDTAAGTLLATLREGEATGARLPVWTPDGRAVAVGHNEGLVRLYSTEMPPPEPGAVTSSPGVRIAVAVTPDDQTIVTANQDGRLRMNDVTSGAERLSIKAHQAEVVSVAIAPDGRIATGGNDGQVRIWDPQGKAMKTLAGPSLLYTSVAFAGSSRLVSAGGGFHVWDLESGALRHNLAVPGANPAPAVSADELALGHVDGAISRWDLATGRELERVNVSRDSVDRIAFVQGGRGLAAVTARGDVIVRDASHAFRTLGSVDCGAEGCLLAADAAGTRIVVVQVHRHMTVFDVATGQRSELQGDAFQGVALGPGGKHVAGMSPFGILQVWDVDTGRPRWRGPLLREDSGEVYTHLGWASLSGGPVGPSTAWRRAVEAEGLLAKESGDTLCLVTLDGGLEVWSESRDERLARVPVADFRHVQASDRGCVLRTDGGVSLVDLHGKVELLEPKASAIYAHGGTILVGLEGRVRTIGGATEVVDPGVTAVGRTGAGELLVGYGHGGVQVRRAAGTLVLENTPSAEAIQIVAGPSDLVAASFSDGTIGLWSGATGQPLQRWWLHGEAQGIVLRGSRLLALTEVGQSAAWAVDTYSLPSCELLARVWRAVPVIWEGGRPVLVAPPAGHRCAAGARAR